MGVPRREYYLGHVPDSLHMHASIAIYRRRNWVVVNIMIIFFELKAKY